MSTKLSAAYRNLLFDGRPGSPWCV